MKTRLDLTAYDIQVAIALYVKTRRNVEISAKSVQLKHDSPSGHQTDEIYAVVEVDA